MDTKIKPYNPSANELESDWHVIDAQDKILGRLSSEAATLLMGKHRPEYVPHLLSGDFVIITNAAKVKVTGNKADQIVYRRHSQKPGKLKEIPYRRVQEKAPTRIIEHAVRGMLPKNKLGERMIRRLKVYAGEEHPHVSQIAWTEQRPERDAKAAIEAEELAKKRTEARQRAVARQQIAEDVAEKTTAADAAKIEEPKDKKPAAAAKAEAPEETTAAGVVAEPEVVAETPDEPEKAPAKKPAARRKTAAKAATAETPKSTTTRKRATTSTRKKADSTDNESADAKPKAAKPRATAKKPAAKKPAAKKPAAKKKPATAKSDE